MSRDDLHFRLRIPADLKSRVEAAAQFNRRSMTAEIVDCLMERYPPQEKFAIDQEIRSLQRSIGDIASHIRDGVGSTEERQGLLRLLEQHGDRLQNLLEASTKDILE